MIIIFRGHRFIFDMAQLRLLLVFFVQYIISLFSFGKLNDSVVMYGGHGLTGNLKGYWDFVLANELGYDVYYLSLDKGEYERLRGEYGGRIIYALSFSGMRKVLRSKVLMTSHGPGLFYALKWLKPKIKFVDVWHGIPFKRFKPGYWDVYKFYSAMFVSSEHVKHNLYFKNYGLDENIIFPTGYARIDMFCEPESIAKSIRGKLQLDSEKYVILFAPTWRYDEDISEIPFGVSDEQFFRELNELCEKNNAVVIFRPHWGGKLQRPSVELPNIVMCSKDECADTNELLTAVDMLITDWSSIAIDFYALVRPVLFVNTPKPTHYQPEKPLIEQIGHHVNDMEELLTAIEGDMKLDEEEVKEIFAESAEKCYGDTLDGRSAERYDKVLRSLLGI